MAFDNITLAACVHELQPELTNAKIVKIHQPDRHSIIIKFYGSLGNKKLLLSADSNKARIHLTETTKENPATAPLFCMVLRKWLEGAQITAIRQTEMERVACLDLRVRNDIGDILPFRLIIEIMGKHSNIILVNHEGLIVDGIHRYTDRLSRYRQVLPNQPYIAPPPMTKINLSNTGNFQAEFTAAISNLDSNTTISDALNKYFAGISPFTAREIAARAGIAAANPLTAINTDRLQLLSQELAGIYAIVANNAYQPTMLLTSHGTPEDFAALSPLLWQDMPTKNFASMNQAIDNYYAYFEQAAEFATRQKELHKATQSNLNRLEKKIALQEEDLAKAEQGDFYRTAGDLLAANLYHIPAHAQQTELDSFYKEGEKVAIELDPNLSPEQNMKKYYRRYTKAKKAYGMIEVQLTKNNEERDYLLSIVNSIEKSDSIEELAEIRKELEAASYIRPKAPRKGGKPISKTDKEAKLPPRTYVSIDGFTILIGRNNRQNDTLTLKTAQDHDIWLHAQKIPGSHVIIRTEGKPVPQITLTEAAAYAAFFSKAGAGDNVPVDYTTCDQVKKPNGAKPGMVIYFKQKTLYVTPKEPSHN